MDTRLAPERSQGTQPDLAEQLQHYLDTESRQHQHLARWNARTAVVLVLVGIFASGVASVHAAAGQPWGALPGAAIAAIPAALLLINNTIKFDERSRWHKLKQRKLEAFRRELSYQGASSRDVAARLNLMLEEMESTRVELGVPEL